MRREDSEQRPCCESDSKPLTSATVTAVDNSAQLFDVDVADMQSDDISIANGKITGTVKYLSGSNAITNVWGEGNFLCLAFSNWDANADKVLVGLDPSMGSGLADVKADPDHNGIFKVTNKNTQRFVVCVQKGSKTTWTYYSLADLDCEDEGV